MRQSLQEAEPGFDESLTQFLKILRHKRYFIIISLCNFIFIAFQQKQKQNTKVLEI